MRWLAFFFCMGCADGLEASQYGIGTGPVTKINPLQTLDTIDRRPKCELPSTEQLGALYVGHVAGTKIAAHAGFDAVDALFEEVDKRMPDVRACEPKPFTQTLTNGVSHRISGEQGAGYRHINTLTFVPDRRQGALSQAVGDLYLHGSDVDPSYLVVRNIDFRKYLFQDIILHDCEAHPERCDSERAPGPGNRWTGAEKVGLSVQNEPFDSDVFQCIRNVHGYFAEFNRITKKIEEKTKRDAPPKRLFHLTNNCREPGNYELALVAKDVGKQWGNHISLDIGFYGRILDELGVKYEALGTGVRIVGAEREDDGSYRYVMTEKKAFPANCPIQYLLPYVGKAQRLLTPTPEPIKLERGSIPWEMFASETQAKSGRGKDEGIVYVEVDGSRPTPIGFTPKGFHFETGADGVTERVTTTAGQGDWPQLTQIASAERAIHVPHLFQSFAEVGEHPFQISAFEVDGRYLGRMKARRLAGNSSRMYSFDYGFLKSLKTFEARVAVEKNGRLAGDRPRLEFRLLNEACEKKTESCVQVILGNLELDPGEETQFVLGIGTQPLRDLYLNNVYQRVQKYALTYDGEGNITDLATRHGLGKMYVRRGKGRQSNQFVIDLVSYERAVPIWRGTVHIPEL